MQGRATKKKSEANRSNERGRSEEGEAKRAKRSGRAKRASEAGERELGRNARQCHAAASRAVPRSRPMGSLCLALLLCFPTLLAIFAVLGLDLLHCPSCCFVSLSTFALLFFWLAFQRGLYSFAHFRSPSRFGLVCFALVLHSLQSPYSHCPGLQVAVRTDGRTDGRTSADGRTDGRTGADGRTDGWPPMTRARTPTPTRTATHTDIQTRIDIQTQQQHPPTSSRELNLWTS